MEKQTLEGMRRDRKTFGSKQNVSSTTATDENADPDKPEPERIAELDNPEPDPFWDTTFDMFVEDLQKRPPKRSVRRKKVKSEKDDRSNLSAADVSQDSKMETVIENNSIPDTTGVVVKKEPVEEREEFEEFKEIKENKEVEEIKETKQIIKEDVKVKKEEKEKEKEKPDLKGGRVVKKTVNDYADDDDDLDVDLRDLKSDSESTENDDDDSLSISGLESESSESGSSEESSNSDYTSDDDSGSDVVFKKIRQRVQTRLQTRSTRQSRVKSTGMRLR